jgi:hypothetical protein
MRRAAFAIPLVLSGVLLAGCSVTVSGTPSAAAAPSAGNAPAPAANASLPPLLPPATTGTCPYLSLDEVQNDNGQHVGAVKISGASDGQQHPVCYFYRPDGHLQMTVRVYVGSPSVATGLVNQAAPVATSSPATEPAGWTGGSQALSDGSVYAVSKAGTAVIVTSNQLQTIKCRLVVTAVVAALG